ncbi:hypothetical protein [Streptomyces achromogenes]|uniref:hypothetical protein n=1 Tax=Streptomyces achromogenes TaxID=67255 RepID=UPI0033FCD437
MSSSNGSSAADQQLIDHAARHGLSVSEKRLAVWRRAGLLPANVHGGGLGRGKGSTSSPPPESYDLVLALARRAGRGKRPADLALLLFADGLPVPEPTVRAAFRNAVDTIAIPGDYDGPGAAQDLDRRLDHLADHLVETGQTVTLVPARARRIDERIAAALGEPPAELTTLDSSASAPQLTPRDATLSAVSATLGGSVSLQEIGDLVRAMNPTMTVHPIASLIETTQQDVPDAAAKILADDGSLTAIPAGDVRDLLRDLAETAPLEDLAVGWSTAMQVRTWALDLCERVENELDAEHLAEATLEWLCGRQLMSGLSVIETLRDRRWSPTKGALSALTLLFLCDRLAVIDDLVPGCQWHVLEMPGVLPPPVREMITAKAARTT